MCDLVGTIVLLHIYAIKYSRVTPLLCRIYDSIISDIGENNSNEAKNIEHLQFSSVTQSCPTPCDPMDHSTPDLPVHHRLLEPTQTHVH